MLIIIFAFLAGVVKGEIRTPGQAGPRASASGFSGVVGQAEMAAWVPGDGRLQNWKLPRNIIIMARPAGIRYILKLWSKACLSQFAALPGGSPCRGPDYRRKE